MKLHPREALVNKAKVALLNAVEKWMGRYALTPTERAGMWTELLQGEHRDALRWERHGDYNKAAGLENG